MASYDNEFICKNCGSSVKSDYNFGSSHRNHCPVCGYSVHVDNKKGDRSSTCTGLMEPIGLSYKSNDEISLIHRCLSCGKINYNRIAGDDDPNMILKVLHSSFLLDNKVLLELQKQSLVLITAKDEEDVRMQLFGLTNFK